MYNLIITAQKNAWDSRFLQISNSRFGEFTSDSIKSKFEAFGAPEQEELQRIPTIFAYEGTAQDYRIGKITKIETSPLSPIHIEFDFFHDLAPIPFEIIEKIRVPLQIKDSSELHRTHWAVKDVDLFTVLREVGISRQGIAVDTVQRKPIPTTLMSKAAEIMSQRYTENMLLALFDGEKIPSPTQKVSKQSRCTLAFRWLNTNAVDPHASFHRLIDEIMHEEPKGEREKAAAEIRQHEMNQAIQTANFTNYGDAWNNPSSYKRAPITIGSRLGRGAYGEVFSATDSFGRQVAAKFLHETHATMEYVMGHAKALALAGHPAVVTLYSVEESVHPDSGKSMPVILMELLDGEDLNEHVARNTLSDTTAHEWCLTLLEAISTLHSHKAFHGDLHTGNIRITSRGPRIMDILYTSSIAHLSTQSVADRVNNDLRECRAIIETIILHTAGGEERARKFKEMTQGFRIDLEKLTSAVRMAFTGHPF